MKKFILFLIAIVFVTGCGKNTEPLSVSVGDFVFKTSYNDSQIDLKIVNNTDTDKEIKVVHATISDVSGMENKYDVQVDEVIESGGYLNVSMGYRTSDIKDIKFSYE